MKLYGAFEKVEPQDDGTLKVYGYASSEAVDSDGEVVKASAIADAIPDYMRFGAVREMHQASAAGTAIEMAVEDDGRTRFGAHVVDPVAVKKVQTGTYKGFSIGGKVTGRDAIAKNTITGIRLVEVSLVDRPANPEAVFTMYKADGIEPDATATDDTPAADAPSGAPVAKGLDTVACLADILQRLQWIAQDSAWEADYEGDRSPIPARLKAWLGEGAAILAAMSAEEAAEAVAAVPDLAAESEPAAEGSVLAMSADVGDVAKGADAVESDALAKRFDALAAQLTEALAKLGDAAATNDDLAKRLQALEDLPAPPKGVLRAVTKAEDTAAAAASAPPVDLNDPTALMKAAQSRPVFALGAPAAPVTR